MRPVHQTVTGISGSLQTEASTGTGLSAKRVGKRRLGMSRQQQPGQGCEPRAWLGEVFLVVFPPGITWAADLHTDPSLAQQLSVREPCPAGKKNKVRILKGKNSVRIVKTINNPTFVKLTRHPGQTII